MRIAGLTPPPVLNVFSPRLVSLVYLFWGVRCNPHRSHLQFLCVTKMSKILNFLVNTCVQNAPKPVFGQDSAPNPAGELTTLSRPSGSAGEGDIPSPFSFPSTPSACRSPYIRLIATLGLCKCRLICLGVLVDTPSI